MTAEIFNGLINGARRNDHRAIGILSEYCIKAIKSHLNRRFNDRWESEDFARDIFTYKIYSNLPDAPVSYPLAWLYKIADNYMYDYFERHAITTEFRENAYPDEYFEGFVNKFMLDEVFKHIDKVTCRILVLNYYYGYTFEEIAPMVKMKPDAVRQRAYRVKINKKILSQFGKN